jgi:stage V sporulation protein T
MKAYEMMKDPDQAKILCDTYDDMIADLAKRIVGLENQLKLVADKRNAVIQANRTAKTVIDIFDRICEKKEFDKDDLSLMIEKIYVHNDHINIHLKSDIDALLNLKEEDGVVNFNFDTAKNAYTVTLKTTHQRAKVYSVNVVSIGDPMEIYTERDELMLKKYSPIATLEKVSYGAAKSLADLSGYIALVCDGDEIISSYGRGGKAFEGKTISDRLTEILRGRKSYVANLAEGGDIVPVLLDEENTVTAQVIVPIVCNGDCLGAILLVSFEVGARMDGACCKLAQLTSSLMAAQFEE